MPTVQQVKVYENGQWVTKVLYFPPSSHDHPNYLDAITSLDLRISELEKNGTGGGVSVAKVNELIESYLYDTNEQATLPSTGQIDYIYFNQFLTKEEIVEILSTLDMITYDENSNYYRAFYGENGNYLDIFYDTNESIYFIKYGNNTIWNQANNNGFTTNSINVNDVSILLDWATGVGMSVQNVKLTDLISNAPFYKNSVYALATELRALSDRVLALENNSGGVTVEEVNEIVKDNLQVKEGDPVPNTGIVENLYINTELTHEEIVEIIKPLDFVLFGSDEFVYVIASTADATNLLAIIVDNVESPNALAIGDMGANPVILYDYEGILSGGDINGWNTLIPNPIPVNVEAVSEFDGVPVGQQNDLIAGLIATSPIVETDKYTTKGKVNEIVDKHLYTTEPTAVPTSGFVEKVYFNTKLTNEEIMEIVNVIPLVDSLGLSVVLSNGNGETQLGILRDSSNCIISGSFLGATVNIYNSDSGWNYSEMIINSAVVSSLDGLTIGQQNELLKNLVSITPFTKNEKYMTNNELYKSEIIPITSSPLGVGTVYFETNLLPIYVDAYLSKLTYVDFNGMSVNVLFTNETGTNILLVFKDGVKYEIFHATSIDGSGYTQIYYTDNGWLLDKFEINDFGVSELMGLSIGAENELIKYVANLGTEKKEKFTTKEVVNSIVDSYLYKEENPTKVPSTGYVDKIYFNTSLRGEQVYDMITRSIVFDNDGLYSIIRNEEDTILYGISFNSRGILTFGNIFEMISSNYKSGVLFAWIQGSDTEGMKQEIIDTVGFYGWNPNFNGVVEINSNVVDMYFEYSIGIQNELLKDLISTTPFGKQDNFVRTVFEDVEEFPDENASYNPNVIYRKPIKEYHLYLLEDGEAFNFSEFLKSQGGTVNFIEVSELPTEPSVVMDEATFTITLYILNKTDLYGYMDGWFSNDELASMMDFGSFGGIVNSVSQINAENTGYVLAKIKQYSYANIKDGVKSEFVTNKDKAKNLPLIIEKTGKTTTNEDFNIEEVVEGVTITYEEAKSLYDSPNSQIKLSFIANSDLPTTFTFNKKADINIGDGFMMSFACNYSTTRTYFLTVTGVTPSSQAGIIGMTSTYATKTDLDNYMTESDVLQEIENYMTTHYENGNEGSY